MRVEKSTVKNYKGKINRIQLFFLSVDDPIVLDRAIGESGDLVVPLCEEDIKRVFSWLSTDRDLPKRRKVRSSTAASSSSSVDVPILAVDNVIGVDNEPNLDEEYEDEDEDEDELNTTQVDADPNAVFEGSRSQATISSSCMQGYKSALLWYYGQKNVSMSADIDDYIEDFISGYAKLVQQKKATGVMELKEGKSHMQFLGYLSINKYLTSIKAPINGPGKRKGRGFNFMEFVFAWVFMVLCWNLMGRANSIASINFQHIDWSQDCMTITYASSKTDKKGTKEGNTKHVYANPLEPAICPVLAVAVYLFCFARNGQNSNMFPGEHASDRSSYIQLYAFPFLRSRSDRHRIRQ
jgi:hypothetical protein